MIKTREGYKFHTVDDMQKYATEMAMKYILDGYKMATNFTERGGFNLEKDGNHIHIVMDVNAHPFSIGDDKSLLECITLEVAETSFKRTSTNDYVIKACWFRVTDSQYYVESSSLALEFYRKRYNRRHSSSLLYSWNAESTRVITGERLRPIMSWVNKLEGCKSLKLKDTQVRIWRDKYDGYVEYRVCKKNRIGSPRTIWVTGFHTKEDK